MTAPANQFLALTNVINVSVLAPGAQLAVPNMSALANVALANEDRKRQLSRRNGWPVNDCTRHG